MQTVAKRRAKAGRKGRTGTVPSASRASGLAAAKVRFTLHEARASRLLGGEKTRLLSARLSESLVTAAKRRTGISSDTRLVELALASLAIGDDFGEWLVTQGGRLKADFEIDL